MVETYLGLGSNLENPRKQVHNAIQSLKTLPSSHLTKCSTLHETIPVGPMDQPNFINAVVCLETELSPHDLLRACQAIENQHNRKRTIKWGPRTLDIDILLYGELTITTPELTIPHPEMHKRDFVLVPLLECAPQFVMFHKVPNSTTVAATQEADEGKEVRFDSPDAL